MQVLNMDVTPKECVTKWRNLNRSYKSVRDNTKKTGSGTIRFQYCNEIDDIIGDKPCNTSEHVIESSIETTYLDPDISERTPLQDYEKQDNNREITNGDTCLKNVVKETPKKRERRQSTNNKAYELLQEKIEYYKQKRVFLQEEFQRKRIVEEKNQRKKRKEELAQKKLKIEEEKIQLLKQLVKFKS